MKYIKKIDLPTEDSFEIESFIAENIDLNKKDYKLISYQFSDNYVFVVYEKVASPTPASGFVKT
jgi:hypothetical protein